MKLGVGLWSTMVQNRGSVTTSPLMAVSAFNAFATETTASGTNAIGYEDIIFKVAHVIGSGDVTEIVLAMNNWALGLNATDGLNLPANGYTIKQLWLTTEAGISVQVTVGGLTTWTVASGGNDVQSDPILPSDFGLGTFARNLRFVLGGILIPVDSGGTVVFGGRYASIVSDMVGKFAAGQLTLRAPVGAYPEANLKTFTGALVAGGAQGGGSVPPIIMLGKFDGTIPPVYMGVGDSITAYINDTATALKPTSFFGRALLDNYASPTSYRAGLKAGRPSGDARNWAVASANGAQAVLAGWCGYCNVLIERHGTNNRSYPSQYDAKKVIWDLFATNHGGTNFKRVAVALTGSTTSTDSWATLANQTLGSETGPAGALASMNNAALAAVGTDVDYYLETLGIRGNVDKTVNDYWRWATGPTTTDGLHPNSTAHELMAADLRSLMTTIESGW